MTLNFMKYMFSKSYRNKFRERVRKLGFNGLKKELMENGMEEKKAETMTSFIFERIDNE